MEKKKSKRELAMEWWYSLSATKQANLFFDYREFTPALGPKELTGREIEKIWDKIQEEEKALEEFKVNFELLKDTITFNENSPTLLDYFSSEELINLKMFFKLLVKSPEFAQKAHLELNN